MTPAQLIAQAILAEMKRQAEQAKGVMDTHIDDELGAKSTYIDGVFDLDAIGAAIIAHPPCQMLHVRMSDDGQRIRKWQRTPFDGAHATLAIEAAANVPNALLVFAACYRAIKEDTPDDEWAKFRLLTSDYRRAHAAYVALTGQEPPYPEDAHAALEPRYLIRKGGAFYRPNAQGYTRVRSEAGRFTLAEAISQSHPNGPDGPRDGITYALDDGTEGEWL